MSIAPPRWYAIAVERLEDTASCPRCGGRLEGQQCQDCDADFSGGIGAELWDASQAAVAALRARQDVLDRVPLAPVVRPSAPRLAPIVPRPDAPVRASATVQSVLAVAGAGLVAVAALVFTFLNPDLTDPAARGVVVGIVTLVFLGGAAVLARRALRFSAEAVAALGAVFLALDVHAVSTVLGAPLWLAAALASLGVVALAQAVRLRVWLWAGTLGLALAASALPASVIASLAAGLVAVVLLHSLPFLARRVTASTRLERTTLAVVLLLAAGQGSVQAVLTASDSFASTSATLTGVWSAFAVLAALATAHVAPRASSIAVGVFGTAAIAALPFVVVPMGEWTIAILLAAAVVGAVVVGVVAPMPRTVDRGALAGGVIGVVGTLAAPPTAMALVLGAAVALGTDSSGFEAPIAVGIAALALGLVAFAWLRERRDPAARGARWVGYLGVWYGMLALLLVLTLSALTVPARVVIGLVLASALGIAVSRMPVLRRPPVAVPLVVGAHVLVLFAAILSWRDAGLAVAVGAAVLTALAAVAAASPARARFAHVGVGYAYALVVLATAFFRAELAAVVVLCLITSIAAVAAVAATFVPRLRIRSWYAILAVTAVPFVLGVVQVVFERSGWTALSTSLIFVLALTLVSTRRAGVGIPLRLSAAGILVPSLAVVAVCLGAQLLEGSGSPVVLPVIAAIVGIVLPAVPLVRAALTPRIGERHAALAGIAVEATTLLTAAIATGLALVREAAGLGTTLLVLVILGVGGIATAYWGGRRYGWALAGAAFSGALWSAWGLAGVTLLEPYLLPPTLGAALVGALLVVRGRAGREARGLYAAGLLLAIAPLVVLTAVSGTPVRGFALLAAAGALAVLSRVLPVALRRETALAAIVAAAVGAAQGVRFGIGADAVAITPILACLAVAIIGAAAAYVAAPALRPVAGRWATAPAFAILAVGSWAGIERDWFAIWTMWALLLVLLTAVVAIAWRGIRRETFLPPVWFAFGLAFATAVVAWSPRDLRVEWFSLPLGAALLAAGALALGATDAGIRRSYGSWPAGWSGSWALLAPGLVVMMSASITATFTDPLTWRAILVIVLALAAILLGAARRLAAPFLIGIVVLPVENVFAFLVQIGRGIEAMPWWITLAVVGAVLLIIAVTYERRADQGIAARLRDLA